MKKTKSNHSASIKKGLKKLEIPAATQITRIVSVENHIDFRRMKFGKLIDGIIQQIYGHLHDREGDLFNLLQNLEKALGDLSVKERLQAVGPVLSAKEIFSGFLQQLIYFYVHNIKHYPLEKFLEALSKCPLFYNTLDDKGALAITIWEDPKEKTAAFHAACRFGKLELFNFVLKKFQEALGVDAAKKLKNPISSAHSEKIHAFLTHPNKDKFSPFNAACAKETTSIEERSALVNSFLEMFKKFFSGDKDKLYAFITQVDVHGFGPLNSAAFAGYEKIVASLLQFATKYFRDPDDKIKLAAFLTHRNKEGFSALNSACKEGRIGVVRELLKFAKELFAGDPEGLYKFLTEVDEYGFSPFNSAANAGRLDVVEELIRFAEEHFEHDKEKLYLFATVPHKEGISPLHAACKDKKHRRDAGDVKDFRGIVVRILNFFKKHFSENKARLYGCLAHCDGDGFSALNAACFADDFYAVEELLRFAEENFADDKNKLYEFLTAPNKEGFSPLLSACVKGKNGQIVGQLLRFAKKHFGDDKKRLYEIVTHSDKTYGFPSLNAATKANQYEAVKIILEFAVENFDGKESKKFKNLLNAQNGDGFTPINAACLGKNKEIAKLLLTYGPDLKIKNKNDYGPLDNAPEGWRFILSPKQKNHFSSNPHGIFNNKLAPNSGTFIDDAMPKIDPKNPWGKLDRQEAQGDFTM